MAKLKLYGGTVQDGAPMILATVQLLCTHDSSRQWTVERGLKVLSKAFSYYFRKHINKNCLINQYLQSLLQIKERLETILAMWFPLKYCTVIYT